MADTYFKLGDKTFKSSGDPAKDIELIKQNFPDVDTEALSKSLSGQEPPTQKPAGVVLPDRVQQLKSYAEQFNPSSKEYKKAMDAYTSERDDFLKLNPGQKPDQKEEDFGKKLAGAGKNIKYAFDVLDQIETTKGDVPFGGTIYGKLQKLGSFAGLNPEVNQYEDLKNGILTSFAARSVGGEKGAMSDSDIERAKQIFPKIEYNQKERDASKTNVINLLKNADPSQDWEGIFKQPSSFLKTKISPSSAPTFNPNNIQNSALEELKKRGLQ